MLPAAFELPAAVLIIAGGAMACFAGYRLFRIVLAIYGFMLGAVIASSIVGVTNTIGMLAAALGGGLVGALMLVFAYFVGIALVGAALGALLTHGVWTQFSERRSASAADHRCVDRRRARRDVPAALRHRRRHRVRRRLDDRRRTDLDPSGPRRRQRLDPLSDAACGLEMDDAGVARARPGGDGDPTGDHGQEEEVEIGN